MENNYYYNEQFYPYQHQLTIIVTGKLGNSNLSISSTILKVKSSNVLALNAKGNWFFEIFGRYGSFKNIYLYTTITKFGSS